MFVAARDAVQKTSLFIRPACFFGPSASFFSSVDKEIRHKHAARDYSLYHLSTVVHTYTPWFHNAVFQVTRTDDYPGEWRREVCARQENESKTRNGSYGYGTALCAASLDLQ
jgi:hypothetical protein